MLVADLRFIYEGWPFYRFIYVCWSAKEVFGKGDDCHKFWCLRIHHSLLKCLWGINSVVIGDILHWIISIFGVEPSINKAVHYWENCSVKFLSIVIILLPTLVYNICELFSPQCLLHRDYSMDLWARTNDGL